MENFIEYDIIRSQHHGDLVHIVRRRLEEGWMPTGGMTAVVDGQGHTVLYQTLTRLKPGLRPNGSTGMPFF